VYDDLIDNPECAGRFSQDLERDRGHQIIARTAGLQLLVLGLILYAFGGWPFVVWGIFVRTAFVYHGTWLVNSAAHLWGYQAFDTNEGSRNNWWVALVSYGEGWHNNHHAYLSSAAHGLRWWEFDITYLHIRVLALAKLARRIRLPQGNPAKLPAAQPQTMRPLRLPIPSLSV
jgi:stearoyl-CoA desaturase (delta-9 desaturase)